MGLPGMLFKIKSHPTNKQSQAIWVKSGNFGLHVNSDIHLQTGNPDETAPYGRLIKIFIVCIANYFLYSNN